VNSAQTNSEMPSKLILFSLVVFLVILILYLNNRSMAAKSFTFLALGDSYTIGEGVALFESFPYQTIQLLRKAGHNFNAPEMLAKTGWTTDDLKKGIRNTVFQSSYDFVTLLIGVNDQYSGKSVNDYKRNFEQILQQAIGFAGNNAARVFVLSIPDWGKTPFANSRGPAQISRQIKEFNAAVEQIARQHRVTYLDMHGTISAATLEESLLAPDQLHFSGKEYARWGQQLLEAIQRQFV
jgi:lysophospholipase L1-like esterase